MYPCPGCKRHLRDTEIKCPFCGADLPSAQVSAVNAVSAWTGALAVLVMLGSSACSRDDGSDAEAGTTTSHDSAEDSTTTIDDTSESGMMGTETDTDDGTDDVPSEGGSFYASPGLDLGGALECDPWFQDCPDGEKCVPYASTGGNFDANKCVPILGDGQPGEACTYAGVGEATDDCDATSVCSNVELIDGELVGTCTAFCTGTPDQPECSDGSSCLIANDGSFTVCLHSCDALEQDCEDGFGCVWGGDDFVCLPAPDEQPEQACTAGECPAGSVCVLSSLAPTCDDSACCTAFCSLSEPSCVAPASECVPFFDGPPPAGHEDIGICAAAP
jgi:hypothetical protein